MSQPIISVIGGGAAGFFFAVNCAEQLGDSAAIHLYEKGPNFLSKVKISGGGRCNVTHACFDLKQLCGYYPRGAKELLSAFARFQPAHTIEWFFDRGIQLKAEVDGRMFPSTNTSQTILDCLLSAAERLKVRCFPKTPVIQIEACSRSKGVKRTASAHPLFQLTLEGGKRQPSQYAILATGGSRTPEGAALAEQLGHTLIPAVPSLFTFNITDPRLQDLQGLSVPLAKATLLKEGLNAQGPILITHWGLSGPCILKLSAWGARALAACDYNFDLSIDWLPTTPADLLAARYTALKGSVGTKRVHAGYAEFQLPQRLWERLCAAAGISAQLTWAQLAKSRFQVLVRHLKHSVFAVSGKSMNKEEFVTCGGIALNEIDFKTMQSRHCPGLYCIGEALDIDGLTGGFNFQACWTEAWIAAQAVAQRVKEEHPVDAIENTTLPLG